MSVIITPNWVSPLFAFSRRLRSSGGFTFFWFSAGLSALGSSGADGLDVPLQDLMELKVHPPQVLLRGLEERQSLLVTGTVKGEMVRAEVDLTREAKYASADPAIAGVSPDGLVWPAGDGSTQVLITAGGLETVIPVTVEGSRTARPINFKNQIVPLLSKLGCNSGTCHGKAEGQNGFKLSVFGFDPNADYEAIVLESRGRRIMPAAPDHSLLVRKPLARTPHGGGRRLEADSSEYGTLVEWIKAGVPWGNESDPAVDLIEVRPAERVQDLEASQQLQVTAVFSDGSRQDVTRLATYSSNGPPIASVDQQGLVQSHELPGEAAILVTYLDKVAVSRAIIPQKLAGPFIRPPENNFIDALVWDKLEQLGIQPSASSTDAAFLRRAYLDTIGTLPAPDEARGFLADGRLEKRVHLVEELLERPEFADYWALRWADILRIDRQELKAKGAYVFYRWLQESWRENKPYDRFVRELLTAQGSTEKVGPANLYRILTTPEKLAGTVSQVFLGVRIECAQCHHHPYDQWGQDDFYGMVGFFKRVERRSEGEEVDITTGPAAAVVHPRTGNVVPPHPLRHPSDEARESAIKAGNFRPEADPRTVLAEWMTSPANRWFSRAIANRLWAHFFGRGLIEPVDDMRETNPASNEPLLAALAHSLAREKFDLKKLIRTIITSQVYQLSSEPNASNRKDEQNFSHAWLRPISAEVLLDAICQATGRPEIFSLLPPGTRAIQLWDNRLPHYFLQIFGRPLRTTSCECERMNEPSVAQVLHLLNAPEIQAKISHRLGRARRLVQDHKSPGELVDELYLAGYSRLPLEPERRAAMAYLDESGGGIERIHAVEDLLWSLLNTTEFLFNH